jgi:hypothetical protein
MPPATTPPIPLWVALTILPFWFTLLFAALLVGWPFVLISIYLGSRHANRYLRRLAGERTGEDIGTFAHGFDRHAEPFDPWVIRATWDALAPYLVFSEGRVPLRPTDRLEEDLRIDLDDIHFDLLHGVATRSGHSLDDCESNPFYGKVTTVGDFVRFITWQPRTNDR